MTNANPSMQDQFVNLVDVLEYAARYHGQVEVVSRRVEDDQIAHSTYAETAERTRKLASALRKLGVQFGDRVGTLAWNTNRHLEAWYAIGGQGAICHTINPRLFEGQIEYIVNHAEDKILLIDLSFVELMEGLQDKLPSVETYIIQTVGTAADIVTSSFSSSSYTLAPSSFAPGKTIFAPTMGHEYARPQLLAWNIGTTISTESSQDVPNAFWLLAL